MACIHTYAPIHTYADVCSKGAFPQRRMCRLTLNLFSQICSGVSVHTALRPAFALRPRKQQVTCGDIVVHSSSSNRAFRPSSSSCWREQHCVPLSHMVRKLKAAIVSLMKHRVSDTSHCAYQGKCYITDIKPATLARHEQFPASSQ
jgi:hypothetical protein